MPKFYSIIKKLYKSRYTINLCFIKFKKNYCFMKIPSKTDTFDSQVKRISSASEIG